MVARPRPHDELIDAAATLVVAAQRSTAGARAVVDALLQQAAPPAPWRKAGWIGPSRSLWHSSDELAAALGPSAGHAEAAAVIWTVRSSMAIDEREALDALVWRGIDPFDALASFPAETALGADIAHLARHPVNNNAVVGPPSELVVGDYTQYLMVIVKLTRLCSLRCTYCNDWREGPGNVMSTDVQALLLSRLLGDDASGFVDIVWHGGEPTMIGLERALRFLWLQRHFQRPGQGIRNRIQTNGIGLTDEWLDTLAKLGVAISISLDGPPAIHDRNRPDVRGRDSSARVLDAVRRANARSMLSQVLMVGSRDLVALGGQAVLDFLIEYDIPSVGFNPDRPPADPNVPVFEPPLPRPKWVDFLLDLDAARRRTGVDIEIRELDNPITALRGGTPSHCEVRGNCHGTFLTAEPDGALAHCDKWLNAPDYRLGSLHEATVEELRGQPVVLKTKNEHNTRVAALASCEYAELCAGWCPFEREIADRFANGQTATCCGLGRLFEELDRRERGHAPRTTSDETAVSLPGG